MSKPVEFLKIKAGMKFKDKQDKQYKYHIVTLVENQVVFKYYGKHKQWWHYKIQSLDDFNSYIECGLYTMVK